MSKAQDFSRFDSRLVLACTLTAATALRVGTGRTTVATETDLPVIKDALGRPYIPGSSFKGVLRSRVESLLRAAWTGRRGGACNPLDDNIEQPERCISRREMDEKKQALRTATKADERLTDWVLTESCLACQTFGSPWLASRVQIRDWQVDDLLWFDQFQVRDGVSIERDTETAGDGLLYSYEVVPAGTRFSGRILLENGEAWQLGLLFWGLQEFNHGLTLGGATSRGLGAVEVAWDDGSRYVSQEDLWSYIEDPDEAGRRVDAALVGEWKGALRSKLQEVRAQDSEGEGSDDA